MDGLLCVLLHCGLGDEGGLNVFDGLFNKGDVLIGCLHFFIYGMGFSGLVVIILEHRGI